MGAKVLEVPIGGHEVPIEQDHRRKGKRPVLAGGHEQGYLVYGVHPVAALIDERLSAEPNRIGRLYIHPDGVKCIVQQRCDGGIGVRFPVHFTAGRTPVSVEVDEYRAGLGRQRGIKLLETQPADGLRRWLGGRPVDYETTQSNQELNAQGTRAI